MIKLSQFNGMKIISTDNDSFITIERKRDPEGYSGFEVCTHADIVHGRFDAVNTDVQFLNSAEFIEEFDRFVLHRKSNPVLLGTYETRLEFVSTGTRVSLKYRLGDSFCGEKTVDFVQSGELVIDQESLLGILDGFKQMFSGN